MQLHKAYICIPGHLPGMCVIVQLSAQECPEHAVGCNAEMLNDNLTEAAVDRTELVKEFSAMGPSFKAKASTKYVPPDNLFLLCFVKYNAHPAARLIPCIFCCYMLQFASIT
jgi:hypothetical protein